jgi:hypothetical protein
MVLCRDTEHVADHAFRKRECEVRHEVELTLVEHLVDERSHDTLDMWSPDLDGTRGESPRDESAEPIMCRWVTEHDLRQPRLDCLDDLDRVVLVGERPELRLGCRFASDEPGARELLRFGEPDDNPHVEAAPVHRLDVTKLAEERKGILGPRGEDERGKLIRHRVAGGGVRQRCDA